LQLGNDHVDTPVCSQYCRADAASVIRLADDREYWVKRANRVVARLSGCTPMRTHSLFDATGSINSGGSSCVTAPLNPVSGESIKDKMKERA
jgi:hypothetical protein